MEDNIQVEKKYVIDDKEYIVITKCVNGMKGNEKLYNILCKHAILQISQ